MIALFETIAIYFGADINTIVQAHSAKAGKKTQIWFMVLNSAYAWLEVPAD